MLKIEKTTNLDKDLYKDAVTIREQVFVNEQKVPIELEMTGENGPCYYVGYVNTDPVATARVVKGEQQWLIQRVAVLATQRNKHYGSALMNEIERDARKQQVERLVLHAQDNAAGFYEKIGYIAEGEGFTEATIPHHIMAKEL
ncbi:GNAT family N-acetyltransferase [Ligilactobacillus sp. LYQ135]